jgi:hypothetical protein
MTTIFALIPIVSFAGPPIAGEKIFAFNIFLNYYYV